LQTSALHRAITSILDMAIHFTDFFVALAGDTTHNISKQSIAMKSHRSRRRKQALKNVIGFSSSRARDFNSSESDSDESDNGLEPSYSMVTTSISSSYAEDDLSFARIEKLATELDGLVRFVRRGVESLAGGTGDAAITFGVLTFALEDWDL
jgi:gamma-tubulin complex component 5